MMAMMSLYTVKKIITPNGVKRGSLCKTELKLTRNEVKLTQNGVKFIPFQVRFYSFYRAIPFYSIWSYFLQCIGTLF